MKNLLKSPAVKNLSLKRREIDEAIEVAKIYRTDVYWEGKIAWSYSDWVKSKNIPSNVSDAISLLINGSINEQDVGMAKIIGSSETKTRYFVTYSGVGFDSFMLEKIKNYKWLGKLSYLVCAIMNFTKYKNVALEVVTSKTKIDASVFLLGVGICKYTGGGMQLIKDPKGNDGLLNITIALPLLSLLLDNNFESFSFVQRVLEILLFHQG